MRDKATSRGYFVGRRPRPAGPRGRAGPVRWPAMVVALVTVLVIAVLAVLGGGYALSWPMWRPVDPLFERLAVAAPRPLPPDRLQRRILREAMGRVAVGVNGGIMAPSSFEVRLSPEDLEGLGGLGEW